MNELFGIQSSRNAWWILAIRGILAILFGIAALVWPASALFALVLVFGAYALIDGVMAVIVAIQERSVAPGWWVLLIEGIVGILIGLVAFFWPGVTALILLYLVAFWAIFTGITEIASAFSMRRGLAREWTLGIAGVISILFGIVLLIRPGAGLLSIIWLVGIYAIIFGVLFLIRAFQFRNTTPVARPA